MTTNDLSSIVLAGGKSSRLGRDKAFLRIEGRTLIERTLGELASLSAEIIIVSNTPEAFQGLGASAVVPDRIEGIGPLGGIHAGLHRMTNHYGFFVACDMPHLDAAVVSSQIEALRARDADALVPRWDGHIEPLHAIYSKTCLPAVETCIKDGARKIIAFYTRVKLAYWELHGPKQWRTYFHNINTETDLIEFSDG